MDPITGPTLGAATAGAETAAMTWLFWLVLAIAIVLVAVLITVGAILFMRRGNPRIRAARQRRKQAQRRADEQARHAIEVLAEVDALADEVTDLREDLGAAQQRDQLRAVRATLQPGAAPVAGGPPPPPAHP